MVQEYSVVCEHGNLQRACTLCELETEIQEREDLLLAFCKAVDNGEVHRFSVLCERAKALCWRNISASESDDQRSSSGARHP